MATDPLGIDIDCVTDLDPQFRLCRGTRNLGNALLRRLNADTGSLASIGDEPNYGFNVANAVMAEPEGQGALAAITAAVQAQHTLDERVQGVEARVVATTE